MLTLGDVLLVALKALWARPGRALLMAVGPLLGAGVIVGAIGLLQSTTGELREALRRLGVDLVVAEISEGQLPAEAADRAAAIPSVRRVSVLGVVSGASVSAASPSLGVTAPVATGVVTSDAALFEAADTGIAWGRPLHAVDERKATTAAVVGNQVATALALQPGEMQTLYVGAQPFAVVGALRPSLLVPELDHSVVIPASTATTILALEATPRKLLVRVREGTERATAEVLNEAVMYGGPGTLQATVPTDLLAAQTQVDRTLAGAILGFGALAMAIGGFGIANVMLIAVLERRREIGVRRALGHLRSTIALQFLTEATLIGVLGALAGAILGIGFVAVAAAVQGWVVVVAPGVVFGAVAGAIIVTTLAGVYPAVRAARLQPLEALRSD